jgi:hypothetical protein
MNLAQFQTWLNAHGASLVVDGKGGPSTRSAIIETFHNAAAPAATDAEKTSIARVLGGSLQQLRAVDTVESGGAGWDRSGLLKCLYERHYAWRRIKVLIPFLSNPTPGGYTTDADHDGICDSWEKVADMAMRDPLVAFESASWGRFQIMGAHAKSLGYENAIEFVWALSRDEAAHYRALAAFIRINNLQPAFVALSTDWRACTPFARGYNGKRQQGYDKRLAAAMVL